MKISKTEKKKWYKEILKNTNMKNKTSKLLDSVSEFFELPRELVSNSTKVTVIENRSVLIEGYKQIMDYYDNYIKIRTYKTDIVIDGKDLDIKEITDSDLIIQGEIYSLNYKVG